MFRNAADRGRDRFVKCIIICIPSLENKHTYIHIHRVQYMGHGFNIWDTDIISGMRIQYIGRWIEYILLGVRSLANASRARQFNPLNPHGVGWVPLPQTNVAAMVGRCVVVRGRARSCAVVRSRAWSCVVVRGRAWSCVVVRGRAWSVVVVRARSCVVVHGRACMVGHAWSCVVGRGRSRSFAVGRARSCVVVHGRSCAVVRARSVMRGRSCVVGHAWSGVVGRGRAWPCVVVRGRAR